MRTNYTFFNEYKIILFLGKIEIKLLFTKIKKFQRIEF